MNKTNNKQALCWIDEKIIPVSEAKVCVMDHGLLYGDGVFEGLRFYNNAVFKLEQHLKRLQQSANAISLALPFTIDEIEKKMALLIQQYPSSNGYLRLVVTRGVGNLGIDPNKCAKANLFIIVDELSVVHSTDKEGINLHVASTRRMPADCLDPKIKSLNYLNNILARIEANKVGADEAVMLNAQGYVTEGTVDNIFIVQQGVLKTPPISSGILAGITRECILEIAEQFSIQTEVTNLTVYDLINADECFLTGTGAEIIAVKSVNKKSLDVANKTILTQIEEQFRQMVLA